MKRIVENTQRTEAHDYQRQRCADAVEKAGFTADFPNRYWFGEELHRACLPPVAIELILDATGPDRHQRRVEMALAAATAWAGEYGIEAIKKAHYLMVAILDANGIGGENGTGFGCGTTRHPAFATCGKGRKFASDGNAWTAAISEVTRLASDQRTYSAPVILAGQSVMFDNPTVFIKIGEFPEDVIEVGPAYTDTLDKEWWLALARRGVLVSFGKTMTETEIRDSNGQPVAYLSMAGDGQVNDQTYQWAAFLEWLESNANPEFPDEMIDDEELAVRVEEVMK